MDIRLLAPDGSVIAGRILRATPARVIIRDRASGLDHPVNRQTGKASGAKGGFRVHPEDLPKLTAVQTTDYLRPKPSVGVKGHWDV